MTKNVRRKRVGHFLGDVVGHHGGLCSTVRRERERERHAGRGIKSWCRLMSTPSCRHQKRREREAVRQTDRERERIWDSIRLHRGTHSSPLDDDCLYKHQGPMETGFYPFNRIITQSPSLVLILLPFVYPDKKVKTPPTIYLSPVVLADNLDRF